jgi:sugar phosphate isomerase/epimerase
VLIDIWHHSFGPDSWEDLEAVPVDAIAYVELDDAPALAGTDLAAETLSRRVLPGEGIFELDRFERLLRDKAYRGMVSVEILSADWRGRPPAPYAARVHRASRTFLRNGG